MFSGKAISRVLCCYCLVETDLQMTLIKYLLPEAAVGIDEKAAEETADKKFFKCEIFNNWCYSHTHDHTFFIWWRVLTYLMTSSVGTKVNGSRSTYTANLQPSVTFGENFRSIGHQMRHEETKIYSLAVIGHRTYSTALFNNHFTRHPNNSVLPDVLKTKQSHHKEKKTNLKDARYGNRGKEYQ